LILAWKKKKVKAKSRRLTEGNRDKTVLQSSVKLEKKISHKMLSNPAFVYRSELVLQGQILGAIWYFHTLLSEIIWL